MGMCLDDATIGRMSQQQQTPPPRRPAPGTGRRQLRLGLAGQAPRSGAEAVTASRLVDSVARCVACAAPYGQCACWATCACGWSHPAGGQCRNPECSRVPCPACGRPTTLTKARALAHALTHEAETPSRQTATAPDVTRPTDTPDSGQPVRALPLRDGDWQLSTLTVKQEEYTNQFTGRARIRYMGEDQGGGTNSFTITVFVGGKDVATLQGTANDVKPGRTVTVDLFSTDHYVPGRRSYTFQKEL